MRINRKSIAAGLTVGLLAGGAGGAIAATTSGPRTASTRVTTMSRSTRGWGGRDNGWRGTNGRWDPATGAVGVRGAPTSPSVPGTAGPTVR
jgi:hypothetical protein